MGKPDIVSQEASLTNASNDPSINVIKAEKEEILPDSTEDVAVCVKPEVPIVEGNITAKSIDIKIEDNQHDPSLAAEEKLGKIYN